jgi:integrase
VKLREAAARWQKSRVDVAENTRLQHRSAVRAMLPSLGERRLDTLTAVDVAGLVAELSKTRKRETVRKTLLALQMILDFEGVVPNVARDKLAIRLPREQKTEIDPPTAAQIEAVCHVLPTRYRLPLLVLDATGMRLGELEGLTWATSANSAAAGVSRRPSPRRAVPAGSTCSRPCSRPSRRSCLATTACLTGTCSKGSAAIASAPQSRAPAPPPVFRTFRRTT